MKRNRLNKSISQGGFTIVELMIATLVFAVILVLCTFGLMQVTRTYYKGVTSTRTQQAARSITDQISQAIQFGGGKAPKPTVGAGGYTYFCLDNTRYTYKLDNELVEDSPDTSNNQDKHVLIKDTVACDKAADFDTPPAGYTELMSPNMRLAKLQITGVPGDDNLYTIEVTVVYGDNELLDSTHTQCASTRQGTQFCAVSTLSTIVQKRVNQL